MQVGPFHPSFVICWQFQISITDQLPKYVQAATQLITTQCIILEAESLGSKVQGATNIVKQFLVHKCGHEKEPKSATACIKTMVKQNRYIVASQDRSLQDRLRQRPGQPILYLHKKTPVLEQPSELSRKAVELKMNEAVTFGQADTSKLLALKKNQGLATPSNSDTNQNEKKKKKKKQPNPLSCKTKKKKDSDKPKPAGTATKNSNKSASSGAQPAIDKNKRKRIRIAQHVKEILSNK